MIAVAFALTVESSEFIRLLENRSSQKHAGIETVSGRLHGREITVIHTGVGEKSTRVRLARFLEQGKFTMLISAGFAGAVRDSLSVGDLLLAENRSTSGLLAGAQRALRTVSTEIGILATAHAVIDSAGMRQQIARETGAAAVDMETEFIAEICAGRLPMISLRAITDTPSSPFPAPPQVLFNLERQRTEFTPLFWYLLTRPLAMPRFISFATSVSKCRRALTSGLDLLLREELAQP